MQIMDSRCSSVWAVICNGSEKINIKKQSTEIDRKMKNSKTEKQKTGLQGGGVRASWRWEGSRGFFVFLTHIHPISRSSLGIVFGYLCGLWPESCEWGTD